MSRTRNGNVRYRVLLAALVVVLLVGLTNMVGAKPPAGTQITSTATVTWEDAAGNDDYSEQASVIIEVLPVAGVSLDAVTGATRPLQPGKSLSDDGNDLHTVTITNTGNAEDTFDLDLSVDETGTLGWVASIIGDLSAVTLNAGQSQEVQIQLTAPAGSVEGDEAKVTLTATSQFDDNETAQDVLTAWISDVEITVTISAEKDGAPLNAGDNVVPGDEINYTVEVKNEGTSDASEIVVTVVLPDDVTLDETSIVIKDQDGIDVSDDYVVVYDEATGTLTITGKDGVVIEGGDFITIEYDVTVDQFADPDGDVGGSISVESKDPGDTESTKVADFPKFSIDEAADVSVTIVGDAASTVLGGDEVTVVFVITNEGNVTDNMELALSEDPDDETIWKLYLDAAGTQEVTVFETGTLEPGDAITYYAIAVVPANEDGWESEVTLVATSKENVNVSADATFTLTLSAPKMVITISGEAIEPTQSVPNPPTPEELVKQEPGGQVRLTVTAQNIGSQEAKNVVITIPIPEFTTYVAGSLTVLPNPVSGFTTGNMPVPNDPDRIVSPISNFNLNETVTFRFIVEIDN